MGTSSVGWEGSVSPDNEILYLARTSPMEHPKVQPGASPAQAGYSRCRISGSGAGAARGLRAPWQRALPRLLGVPPRSDRTPGLVISPVCQTRNSFRHPVYTKFAEIPRLADHNINNNNNNNNNLQSSSMSAVYDEGCLLRLLWCQRRPS